MRILRLGVLSMFVAATGACSAPVGPEGSRGTAPPPASTGATASAESETHQSGGAEALTIVEGFFVSAGRNYTTSGFRPRFTFHMPEGTYRMLTTVDWPRIFSMNSRVFGSFTLARPRQIFDPTGQRLIPVPEDIAEWFEASPHVTSTKPVRRSFAGHDAVQIDAVVTSTPRQAPDCYLPCLRFVPVADSPCSSRAATASV